MWLPFIGRSVVEEFSREVVAVVSEVSASVKLSVACGSNVVDVGIDLKEFYLSVEWDILAVPAFRNEEYYTSTAEQEEGLLCTLGA